MWFDDLAKLYDIDVELEFLQSEKRIIEDFLNNKYELIGINSLYYFFNL